MGTSFNFIALPRASHPLAVVLTSFASVPSGAYVSNFLIPLYEMGEVEDIGRRTGMAMTFAACGALAGPPISGAIYGQTGGYEAVGYYAGEFASFELVHVFTQLARVRGKLGMLTTLTGSMIVAAVSMMLLVRFMVLRKFWGKF